MLWFALKTLLYGWATALIALVRACRRFVLAWSRSKHHGRMPARHRCVPINEPAFVRPDPLIYDQYYLDSLGLAVTWDNPDIQLYLDGSVVPSTQLSPGTTYEVVAQVWNNSTEAPVVNLPVQLSYLDFGIGTVSVPVGSTQVDLGVKGGANCPAIARWLWTTPATPGHYCLQVQLDPVDDTNTRNNLGQENTDVGTMHSPAVFTFSLRNATQHEQRYSFLVDAYSLAPAAPCDGTPRAQLLDRHRRGTHPVPPGWHLTTTPDAATLSPGQSTPITVTATPPPGFTGAQTINVNAYTVAGLAGGVTLTVETA